MSGASNYPPGVTGNEPELTGEPEAVECEGCFGSGVIGIEVERRTDCPCCDGTGVITSEQPEPEWQPPEERG